MWETWVPIPGLGRFPGEGNWQPTAVFWPGDFHGGYSPRGRKESNRTEWLSLSWILIRPKTHSRNSGQWRGCLLIKSPEVSEFSTDCLVISISLSLSMVQRVFFHMLSIKYTFPLDRFVSSFFISLGFLFSSVQSLSPVRLCHSMDCSTPGFPIHHQLPSLVKPMSVELVMPSKHLSSVLSSSCLQSFPASGCFLISQVAFF